MDIKEKCITQVLYFNSLPDIDSNELIIITKKVMANLGLKATKVVAMYHECGGAGLRLSDKTVDGLFSKLDHKAEIDLLYINDEKRSKVGSLLRSSIIISRNDCIIIQFISSSLFDFNFSTFIDISKIFPFEFGLYSSYCYSSDFTAKARFLALGIEHFALAEVDKVRARSKAIARDDFKNMVWDVFGFMCVRRSILKILSLEDWNKLKSYSLEMIECDDFIFIRNIENIYTFPSESEDELSRQEKIRTVFRENKLLVYNQKSI